MTDRPPEDATPILPAPSFDSEDLRATVRVLQELAATWPEPDDAYATILRAAANIAVDRTDAMLAANGYDSEG